MSTRYPSSAARKYQMPETFSFGLEERPETVHAVKLDIDADPDCSHNWLVREDSHQTLSHEGKTILKCSDCNRTAAVYDWKLEQAKQSRNPT